MVQIATTRTTAEATADWSAGTAHARSLEGTKPMLRLVEPTKIAVKRDPISFWLQLAGEQMVQNIEVMGKLARERVEQELAWDHQESTYLGVYKRVLGQAGPGRRTRV